MWYFYVLIGVIIVIISPLLLKDSDGLRYLSCFTSLILMIGINSVIFIFVFLIYPRNCLRLRLLKWPCKMMTKIIGLKIEGRNLERTDQHGKFIIVANHQSFIDMIGLFCSGWEMFGCCVPIGTSILFGLYPPFGLASWLGGTEFFNKTNNDFSYGKLLKSCKKHFENSDDKRSVLMFAEEFEGDGERLGRYTQPAFKLAIDLKLPIVPLVIAPHSFIKTLQYFKTGNFRYQILDAIETDRYESSEVDYLTKKTRGVMASVYELMKNENEISYL